MAYAKIRPRRGTEYEWNTYDPILSEGELAIQFPDTGIGTGLCKFKVGDGVSTWKTLPFAFDGTAAAAIDGGGVNPSALIQIRSASANAWANANPILVEREIAFCSDEDIMSIKVGDGVRRWNELPYIKASNLIENNSNYDFGSEDAEGDNVMSLSDMEQYITNNSFEGDVFDNYSTGDNTNNNLTGAPNLRGSAPVVPEGVSTAGIKDLLAEDDITESAPVEVVDVEDKPEAEEEVENEEVVEEEDDLEDAGNEDEEEVSEDTNSDKDK